MSGAVEVGAIGLCAAGACLAAYVYAFIFKPVGARWLQIVGLVATMVALVLLSLDVRVEGDAADINRLAAVGFLTVAAVAQAMQALRRRRSERRAEAGELVRIDEPAQAQA